MTQHKHLYHQSVLYMVLSASCLSGSYLFIKIGMQDIPFLIFIFLRFLSPFLLISLGLMATGKFLVSFQSRVSLSSYVLRALTVVALQYSFVLYLTKSSLLNATVLLNTGPLFIPLIEKAFLKQKIGRSTWISLIISAIGVLLVLQPEEGIFDPFMGIGLFAALMQGCSQVLYSLHVKEETHISSLLYLFSLCSLFSFLILLASFLGFPFLSAETMNDLFSPSLKKEQVYLFFFLIAIFTIGNQFFRGMAYSHGTKAGSLAPFLYFSVVLSGLFDWLIFHHFPNAWTLTGGCLIILGGILKIYLRSLFLRKK